MSVPSVVASSIEDQLYIPPPPPPPQQPMIPGPFDTPNPSYQGSAISTPLATPPPSPPRDDFSTPPPMSPMERGPPRLVRGGRHRSPSSSPSSSFEGLLFNNRDILRRINIQNGAGPAGSPSSSTSAGTPPPFTGSITTEQSNPRRTRTMSNASSAESKFRRLD